MSSKQCAGCNCLMAVDEETVTCTSCHSIYDRICANIPCFDNEYESEIYLTSWICVACQSRMRRGGDNSETPIRTANKSLAYENVTHRTKERQKASSSIPRDHGNCSGLSVAQIQDLIAAEIQKTVSNSIETCLCSHLNEIREEMLDYKKSIQIFEAKLDIILSLFSSSTEKIKVLSNEIEILNGHVKELNHRSNKLVMDSPTSIMTQINDHYQKQEIAINKVAGVQTAILAKLNNNGDIGRRISETITDKMRTSSTPYSKKLRSIAATKPKTRTKSVYKENDSTESIPSILHPDFISPRPSLPVNSKNPVPNHHTLRQTDVDQKDDWTKVERRRTRGSLSTVLRGTAAPGATTLCASEKKSYLHLYYVQEGTMVEQVRKHVNSICGNDICLVEALKARGSYASFKLVVPTTFVKLIMSPGIWAEGICIKPWRQNFRAKQDKKQ